MLKDTLRPCECVCASNEHIEFGFTAFNGNCRRNFAQRAHMNEWCCIFCVFACEYAYTMCCRPADITCIALQTKASNPTLEEHSTVKFP